MSPPKTILFINKSAKSKTLTRSEGVERKEIYSHVQQLPVSKTSEEALVISWKVRTGSEDNLDGRSRYQSRRNADEDGSRCRRKKPKAKGGRKAKAGDEAEGNTSRLLDRVSVSIMALNASKLDPFNCSAVSIDERMTATLKIFCNSMTHKIFTVQSWAHTSLRRILTYASESPELLYAVLCSTSGEMYTKSADQTHEYNSIYFKGMAITHLQKSIDATKSEAKSPNVATVRAVCTLLYLAVSIHISRYNQERC
ncbi:hypothetical protein M409DRAFT_59016 [Zasmidium cellare ATCC 36951]|uniref:Uncharacterized protein n=1 Tax=Zasmidium cellare ATCC 36951 TaxID=1080233 RepID=A0A6A6C6X0_ZASCE|nr:uncharacterized protein M409DRAFT_59016 [Zasmidium cellare ATCC 36951]KAF2161632.1 hypothetical protein M409DRAFT_59016 [Zasmidium cellare ATCC 36951]